VCRRTARQRKTLASSRCPGSAALRWAKRATTAAAEAVEGAVGRGHTLLLTGDIMWCFLCGASGNVMARHLARPCCGQAKGFLVYARRRLLLGLHPGTRAPLGSPTVPEVGVSLPKGYDAALRQAMSSSTVAAAPARNALSAQKGYPATSVQEGGRVIPISGVQAGPLQEAGLAHVPSAPAAARAEPAWRVAMLARLRTRWRAEAEVAATSPPTALGGQNGTAGNAASAMVLCQRPCGEPPPSKRRRLCGKQRPP